MPEPTQGDLNEMRQILFESFRIKFSDKFMAALVESNPGMFESAKADGWELLSGELVYEVPEVLLTRAEAGLIFEGRVPLKEFQWRIVEEYQKWQKAHG